MNHENNPQNNPSQSHSQVGHFLAGIAALIWDPSTERYLLLQRSAYKDYASGAWECVTGRVDQGEDFEQALHREVGEEIGASVQIEFIVATTHFYRGPASPENELLGIIYGCTIINPHEVAIEAEHSQARWLTVQQAYEFLPQGYWLRNVIERAELMKAHLPQELRTIYRRQGFDIG
jgi:8-oxo-dGTP diphosphatase